MREYERRSRWTPWHVLAVLLILGVLVIGLVLIYGLTDRGTRPPGASQVAADRTPAASATPTLLPTLPPAAVQPSAGNEAPGVNEPRAAQPPAATEAPPAEMFSAAELDLFYSLREDASDDCAPRRRELPPGADAGIECRPLAEPWPYPGWEEIPYGLAQRVGVYRFSSQYDALLAYLDRIIEAGVSPRSGDCAAGISGDSAWHPIGEGADHDLAAERGGQFFNTVRVGCFLDEDGTANVRVTCGNGLYIGVLGREADLAALYEWTIVSPPDPEPDIPGPVGICFGNQGVDLAPVPEP